MYDFADILTALTAFVTWGTTTFSPTTLIGGAIALAVTVPLAMGVVKSMVGIVRGGKRR